MSLAKEETCSLCGKCYDLSINQFYLLYSQQNDQHPFFPFLETFSKNGRESYESCSCCSQSLLHQWNEFEKKAIPINKRIYWLNNRAFGPPPGGGLNCSMFTMPDSRHLNQSKRPILDAFSSNSSSSSSFSSFGVLDLSCPSKSEKTSLNSSNMKNQNEKSNLSRASHSWSPISIKSLGYHSAHSISNIPSSLQMSSSNLSQPAEVFSDLDFVCFLCGTPQISKNGLLPLFTKPIANCPFFPKLTLLTKPIGAKPIDASGRVLVCESCHKHMINQWETFQRQNVPINERRYSLKCLNEHCEETNEGFGKHLQVSCGLKCVSCSNCSLELPLNMQLTAISVIENVPSFDQTSNSRPISKLALSSAQEIILSPDTVLDPNRVIICVACFKNLVHHDLDNGNSMLRRKLTEPAQDEPAECQLCHCIGSDGKLYAVNSFPNSGLNSRYFPILRDLIKNSPSFDTTGKAYLCINCTTSLYQQWEAFEKNSIPIYQREYRILISSSSSSSSSCASASLPLKENLTLPPQPLFISSSVKSSDSQSNSPTRSLHIQVSSPPPFISSQVNPNDQPLLTTVTSANGTTFLATNSKFESLSEENQHSTLFDEFSFNYSRPLPVSTNCQICGDFSSLGFTYKLNLVREERDSSVPFFPFLKKHSLGPDHDHLLICTYCYHSLISQWIAYETLPNSEDKEPTRRVYNTLHFVCYICGVTTYRNRIKSITVKDFPFLVEHPRPSGALSINCGESVVTCSTCFDTLTSQWRDFERMRVPLEIRKYNWITLPMSRDMLTQPNSSPEPFENLSSDILKVSDSLTSTSLSDITPRLQGPGNHYNLYKLPSTPSIPLLAPGLINSNSNQGITKTSNVQRSLTVVSPLHQNVTSSSTVSTPTLSSSSANLNSDQSSSFAAALRKLAKQACDLTDCNPNGSLINASKTHHLYPNSSSLATINSNSHLNSASSERDNDSRKFELLSSSTPYLFDRPHVSRQDLMNSRTSPCVRTNSGNNNYEHSIRSSSFSKPVTSASDSSLLLPNHVLPFTNALSSSTTSGSHNFFLTSSSLLTHPTLSSHLTNCSSTLRLDDHFYLERYGPLCQGSSFSSNSSPSSGPNGPSSLQTTSASSITVPSYPLGSRYNELLATHQERVLNEERQRLLSHSINHTSNSAHSSCSILLNNSSLGSCETEKRREYSNSGSIMQGTPRESSMVRPKLTDLNFTPSSNHLTLKPLNLTANNNAQQSIDLSNASSIPSSIYSSLSSSSSITSITPTLTNVTTTANSVSNITNSCLWRPQSSEDQNHSHQSSLSNHSTSLSEYTYKRGFNLINESNSYNYFKKQKVINNDYDDKEKDYDNNDGNKMNKTESQQTENLSKEIPNISSQPPLSSSIIFSSSDETKNVISKLDLLEVKLKTKRLNQAKKIAESGQTVPIDLSVDDLSLDEEEESEDELSQNKLKFKLMITKGPPLKLDSSPQKLSFLSSFGLITHQQRQEIEFNKFIKKRKYSRLDFNLSSSTEKKKEVAKQLLEQEKVVLEPSQILPSLINTTKYEANLNEKMEYMSCLGLFHETCPTKLKYTEIIWEGVTTERKRRKCLNLCFNKLLNNLSKETQETWLNIIKQQSRSSHKNGYLSSSFESSLASQKQVQYKLNSLHLTKNNGNIFPKTSHYYFNKNHKKDFSSERIYQKSIEIMESSQNQTKKLNINDATDNQLLTDHFEDEQVETNFFSSSLKWPGIAAVMESYERYCYEGQQEKEFLSERYQNLKTHLNEKNLEAEYLSKKMTNLLRAKKELDEERERYEKSIDELKKSLKQIYEISNHCGY